MNTALTIAGSDSSGGAGIQADIKTMIMNGVYAMTAITALTAQNTTGIFGIHEVPAGFLKKQIDAVFEDIRPDAVKIGMVSNAELIRTIASELKYYKASNIVVDPVMISTSGTRLLDAAAMNALTEELLFLADIITPNIPEASVLSGIDIHSHADMQKAAVILNSRFHCSVLIKGGHGCTGADDFLYSPDGPLWFYGQRIDNPNTHGTGCTLSSAIASGLARGLTLTEAVKTAKEYINGAIAADMNLGKGNGPLNHGYKNIP